MIPRSAAARVVIGREIAIDHGYSRRDLGGVVHGFVCMDQPMSHPVDLARPSPSEELRGKIRDFNPRNSSLGEKEGLAQNAGYGVLALVTARASLDDARSTSAVSPSCISPASRARAN